MGQSRAARWLKRLGHRWSDETGLRGRDRDGRWLVEVGPLSERRGPALRAIVDSSVGSSVGPKDEAANRLWQGRYREAN